MDACTARCLARRCLVDVTFPMKVNMSLCINPIFLTNLEIFKSICSSAALRNFIPLVFHILAQAFVQQSCSYNKMGTHRYNTTVFFCVDVVKSCLGYLLLRKYPLFLVRTIWRNSWGLSSHLTSTYLKIEGLFLSWGSLHDHIGNYCCFQWPLKKLNAFWEREGRTFGYKWQLSNALQNSTC